MSKTFQLLHRAQGHTEILPPPRLRLDPLLEGFSHDHVELPHQEPSDWDRVSNVLKKRWKPAMGFAIATFLAVAVATFLMKPVYEPIARLEVDPPGTEIFSMQGVGNGSGDSEYLQTQAQKMQSDELALEVIRGLRLDLNPDLVPARPNGGAGTSTSASGPGQLTVAENMALKAFHQRVTITRE